MNTRELKQAILEDIETLKHLDLDIMEARLYYGELRRYAAVLFLLVWLPTVVGQCLTLPLYWSQFLREPNDFLVFVFIPTALMALFWTLFCLSAIAQLVVFQNQLRPVLKTGDHLYHSTLSQCQVPYALFVGSVLLIMQFVPFYAAFIAQGVCVFILLGALVTMIDMEMNRIGISTLLSLMQRYFDKKPVNDVEKTHS